MACLRIAMIGTRGVPANYGGFETCVEEVGSRLVQKGHSVAVYCRRSYYNERPKTYKGMNLVYLPNIKRKSLDTLSHGFFSIFHALLKSYDVLMVFNSANAPLLIFPCLLGTKVAVNTDGLEWKRGKWGFIAKRYYMLCERLSTKLADTIVADSVILKDYYLENYGVEGTYIAYGAYIQESRRPELLNRFGLEPSGYFLQVTRFEPENNPLLTIRAFKKLDTRKKLVLVGGARYESDYSRQIAKESGGNLVLPGPIYDKELLTELWCNSYAYIHGNEVGGTNPALLQGMASAAFVISLDVPFNRSVLGDAGIYYGKSADELADKMNWALSNPDSLGGFKKMAAERIKKEYSWDSVADKYESLFLELAGR